MAYRDSTRPETTRSRAIRGAPSADGGPAPAPVASVSHLPSARVPEEDLAAVLSAVLASPGLGVDALRLRAGLERRRFEDALAACRARGLVRQSDRQDSNLSRVRVFPTHLARHGARASGAAHEDAS